MRYVYAELAPLVKVLGLSESTRLPGYRIRIADGNHLGATEHRLKPLQATRSGPLPGQSIAVLDPEQHLVTDIFLCEDAHAHEGTSLALRRVVIKLAKPTRHGDSEVAVFTNLPSTVATALLVAELYLERWSVEKMFQVVTDVFSCELNTLGYPRAALFVFCMAVVAFNILSTLKAALKAVHGAGKIETGLSNFYVVEEVQGTFRGMMIALPAPEWKPSEQMAIEPFADILKAWAKKVNLKRFQSSPRGPKKTVKKSKYDPKHPHVSTARLLNQNKNKRSP